MKYFIASDIHGSAFYCDQLIEQFNASGADKMILLGDILYHGPRNELPLGYEPKKVIEMLNAIGDKIICVRGNCDSEVDQMVLNFPSWLTMPSCHIRTEPFSSPTATCTARKPTTAMQSFRQRIRTS